MKILKISLIASFVIALLIISYRYFTCCNKGKKSGKPYECGFFSKEPSFIIAEEVLYRIKDGKCFEVTDYGETMSFREVDNEICKQQQYDNIT